MNPDSYREKSKSKCADTFVNSQNKAGTLKMTRGALSMTIFLSTVSLK
jgi:hypothetical protein